MNKLAVSEIWIYPVKSLGGIRLQSARVLPKGLEHDRRWMLVDSENRFMTQRVYPAMALFKLSFDPENFSIAYSGKKMNLPSGYEGESITANVWDDTVKVHEVSKQHSEWFSDMLGMNCRLVSFPENNTRPVDTKYAAHNEQVSLADGYPLLIIGQSSLDDLNGRMKEPLPMSPGFVPISFLPVVSLMRKMDGIVSALERTGLRE